MVTGIEAAGLALGLFPLVIEGIKFYISSAEKFKEMKHHKRTLEKFKRELEMEKSKFHNIWYTLVSKAGVLTQPNMEFSSEIMEEVLPCLPRYVVESLVNGFQEWHTILGELMKKFKEYNQDEAGYIRAFRILQHFTKEDREQYIERIHRLNFNLDKLVNGALHTAVAEANKPPKVNVAVHYQRVRNHAIILYGAIKERLSGCLCKIPHSANLQLDVCTLGAHSNGYNNHVPKMGRFSLLFPVLTKQAKPEEYLTLRELEFENLENPDPALNEKIQEHHMKGPSSKLSSPLLHAINQEPITPHSTPSPLHSSPSALPQGFRLLPGSSTHGIPFKWVLALRDRGSASKKQKREGSASEPAYKASERKTESAKHNRFESNIGSYFKKNLNIQTKEMVEFHLPAVETRSSHVESSPAPSDSEQIIKCFCSTIKNIAEMRTCVGILVSNNSKHQVWVPREPLPILTSARVVPLADLLPLPEPSRRERLKLGVRLASSVLQFHRTEWLQERWGKKDICLIQGNSSQSRSPSLETPVVCQAFPTEPSELDVSMESHVFSCDVSLYSLGIVLIELWFWKSVELFQLEEPQYYCCLGTARLNSEKQLIERVYRDAGDNYGNIVRRCIIGLDHKETQLENDGFKNKVYRKVLRPLEKHLELFCDESLEKIFRK